MRPNIFDSDLSNNDISDALSTFGVMLGAANTIGWIAMTVMALLAGPNDPALKGLGIRVVWLIAALFLLTGVPGLVLAYLRRVPRLSLILGGAFPLLFILMYSALTLAFA